MKERILILGSGGREHAIGWKLSTSPSLQQLFFAPGNAGTISIGENLNISPSEVEALIKVINDNSITMVVVGPEQPLAEGIVDELKGKTSCIVIGPKKAAAQLEASKDFSKQFMSRNGIPTAAYKSFRKGQEDLAFDFLATLKPPYVLKADGLAAGKGVIITPHLKEAQVQIKEMFQGKFGQASQTLVIEEFLRGIEVSCFALSDGNNFVMLPFAKDYKRIGDGDTGLNTGGMGTVSPVPFVDDILKHDIMEQIVQPTFDGFKKDGIEFVGFLFIGLMIVDGSPFVVEYNVRLGDPETQVILPRLDIDFLEILRACGNGKLSELPKELPTKDEYAIAVMAASEGYPEAYEKGKVITFDGAIDKELLFHSGTTLTGNQITTNGGRVLATLGTGKSLEEAQEGAYALQRKIHWEGKYIRSDIGQDVMKP